MQKRNLIGMMLAATVAATAIAGCASPAQIGGLAQQASARQTAAGAVDARSSAAQALAVEQEMGDYEALASESDAARYAVAALGGPRPRDGEMAITGGAEPQEMGPRGERPASGEARPEFRGDKGASGEARPEMGQGGMRGGPHFKGKLKDDVRGKVEQRMKQVKEKSQSRLDKRQQAKGKIQEKAKQAAWTANGDGTETQAMSFNVTKTVNGQTFTRSFELKRVRNAESKDLLASDWKASETNPGGFSRTATRTKALNEDGTYTVVFHSEDTFKDGSKRVADWTKTIGADGGVSGTGNIVWTDKDGATTKTSAVKFDGSEEAPTAKAGDEAVTPDTTEAEAAV